MVAYELKHVRTKLHFNNQHVVQKNPQIALKSTWFHNHICTCILFTHLYFYYIDVAHDNHQFICATPQQLLMFSVQQCGVVPVKGPLKLIVCFD